MREFYPFYVTYGSPLLLQGDTMEEREFDRQKEDYPEMARQAQALVERECSRLDYEGSWLYDEHPDKWSVYRLSRKIRRQLEGLLINEQKEKSRIEKRQLSGQQEKTQMEKQPSPETGEKRRTTEQGTPQLTAAGGDFLEELIEVLLFHEISRRRCRRRRYFYPGGRF